MKKYIPLILIIGLFACNNNPKTPKPTATIDTVKHGRDSLPPPCLFGMDTSEFNLTKMLPVEDEVVERGKPVKPTKPPTVPVPTGSAVMLLDFDGHLVHGTSWNYAGDILCSNANLSSASMQIIFDSVTAKWSPWKILVTTDENVFNACDPTKRVRVIFTESYEWYGISGGVSFVGSFGWDDPCFVFTSLLGYDPKKIWIAGCHEAGHIMGLFHQGLFDTNGVLIGQYNPGGCGTPAGCDTAPIEGNAYGQPFAKFLTNGKNVWGDLVDEFAVISSKIPKK